MKSVEEILSGYEKEFFIGACREIEYLNQNGLWPKWRPYMNQFCNDLLMEGYPAAQIQNIAIMSMYKWAIDEVIKEKTK